MAGGKQGSANRETGPAQLRLPGLRRARATRHAGLRARTRDQCAYARRAGLPTAVVSQWADEAFENDDIAACPHPALARVLRTFDRAERDE
jgi:hypothetical protein